MIAILEFIKALNSLNWPAALVLSVLFIGVCYVLGKSFEGTK